MCTSISDDANGPDAHGESVDILVEGIDQGNGLDNLVVVLLDRELDLSSRVGVAQTQLCSLRVALLQLLEELWPMVSDSTKQILNNLSSLTIDEWEDCLDASCQVLVRNTENNLLLLAGLWQIGLEKSLEEVAGDALRNVVGVLQSLGSTSTSKSASCTYQTTSIAEVLTGKVRRRQA